MKHRRSVRAAFAKAGAPFFALVCVAAWGCAQPSARDDGAAQKVRQRQAQAMGQTGGVLATGSTAKAPPSGPPFQTGEPPAWVSLSPPSDGSWHYGVGRASVDEEDPSGLARERALADAAGKIAVTVRKETTDYAGFSVRGKRTVSEQKVEETVKVSTDARLRDPEIVARYRDREAIHVLVRVSALTPLQREMRSWAAGLALTEVCAGEFTDDRGVRTGFADYLRDTAVTECADRGLKQRPDPSVPVLGGRYALMADSISVTLKVDRPDGSISDQRTFLVPAEPDYIAMMGNRRDHSLVNASPAGRWGGGRLSLGGDVFVDGDVIVIRFTPDVDCYVAVFNVVEDGTVTMLLPNRFRRDSFLKAGSSLVFPGPVERDKGLVLRARLPSDKVRTRESIKVVATQRPVGLAEGDFSAAVVEDYRPDSAGIRRLLAALEDLDDRGIPWFEEVQYYMIRAK